MTVTYQRERAQDCFTEVKPLLEAHWQEVSRWLDIPLDPAWERYEAAELAGIIRCYTLRSDGEIRGYALFFVNSSLHYRASVQANQDILYIVPRHRGEAARFLAWCDDQLRDEGVQVVSHHVTTQRQFGWLLSSLGYTPTETVWSRRLDGGSNG